MHAAVAVGLMGAVFGVALTAPLFWSRHPVVLADRLFACLTATASVAVAAVAANFFRGPWGRTLSAARGGENCPEAARRRPRVARTSRRSSTREVDVGLSPESGGVCRTP